MSHKHSLFTSPSILTPESRVSENLLSSELDVAKTRWFLSSMSCNFSTNTFGDVLRDTCLASHKKESISYHGGLTL